MEPIRRALLRLDVDGGSRSLGWLRFAAVKGERLGRAGAGRLLGGSPGTMR
jgi:hypothetical protein